LLARELLSFEVNRSFSEFHLLEIIAFERMAG